MVSHRCNFFTLPALSLHGCCPVSIPYGYHARFFFFGYSIYSTQARSDVIPSPPPPTWHGNCTMDQR